MKIPSPTFTLRFQPRLWFGPSRRFFSAGAILGLVAALSTGAVGYGARAAAGVAAVLCYAGASPSGKSVLQAADFTYLGAMRMPASGVDTQWASAGLTGRLVNGQVRLFVYGSGGVLELADTGVYDTDYTNAPRMRLVTNWGDIFRGKDVSYTSSGSLARFDLKTRGGLYWHEGQKKLYWVFYDNYNVAGRPDWNLGFSTLDDSATGASTAYGPFRTKATDSTGAQYGAWRCMYLWENPIDGTMMCGATLQSGVSRAAWGPSAFGGLPWPDANTPSGFGSPDLNLPDRYLMYYFMSYIDGSGSVGSNPIRSARRPFKPYVFDHFQGTGGSTEVDPALYGGIGSWTEKDYWKGATWLELAGKRGVVVAAALAGSAIQDPKDCAAGHVWYSNAGVGRLNCPHGCAPTGGYTGPTLTAYVPALMIYNPDDLLAVKNGSKTDYTVNPVATIDVADLGAKVAEPGFSYNALTGFYFDPVRNYLFVAAPGADERPASGVAPWTLIHVFRINPN